MEMLSALYAMGYTTDKELHKVAGRAADNLRLATWPADTEEDVELASSLVLDVILKSGSVNSNEPVLLVDVPKCLSLARKRVEMVRMRLLANLRERGIRPVRVYVRAAAEDTADAHTVLLNVVNTDIGGPGMIQLLDAAFHDIGWKDKLLSKEAWHGDELLWRDEVDPAAEIAAPHTEEYGETETKGTTTSGDALSADSRLEGPSGLNDDSQKRPDFNHAAEHADVPGQPQERPGMIEHVETEISEPRIEHPTWHRGNEDTTTLLDIITSQSQSLPRRDGDPVSIISSSREQDEDDFELVNPA